jgi:hypothetical protein
MDRAKLIQVILMCAAAVLGVLVNQGVVPTEWLPLATAIVGYALPAPGQSRSGT